MSKKHTKENSITANYAAHRKAMASLSVADIVRAVDYIAALSQFVSKENEVLDDMEAITAPFNNVINELITEEKCVLCGSYLFKSDLSQYDYVCPDCDENF
jgi:predicted Zn-ribbon and HTH transcriptional regulator